MYDDLRGFLFEHQHGFVKERFTVSNLIEYSLFNLKTMENGFQVEPQIFQRPSTKFATVCSFSNLLCRPSIPHVANFFVYISLVGFSTFAMVAVSLVYLRVAILGPLCFIWFVNEITLMFKYVKALFHADDMKLFLPVGLSHDCLKIQSDLNRLAR
jgi:hypothetical protein